MTTSAPARRAGIPPLEPQPDDFSSDSIAVAVGAWRRDVSYAHLLLAITLGGAFFRLALLGRQELWRDEAFTSVVVQRPIGQLLDAVSRDSAPPLYYVLEHFIATMSTSPWALRLISALAGTALIPLLAWFGRRIAGDRAGLWTAVFVAVLPSTVVASRDARMYALGATLVVASAVALVMALERPTPRRWLVYGLFAVLAIWTDYFDGLALAASLVVLAFVLRPPRSTIIAAVATFGCASGTLVPWLVVARAQFEHAESPFWIPALAPVPVAGSLVQVFIGPPVDPGVPFGQGLQLLQGIAFFAGLAAVVAGVAGRRNLRAPGRRMEDYCLLAPALGVGALLVASVARPLFEARYAGVLWPVLLVLAGYGLVRLPRRATTGLVLAIAVPSLALSVAVTRPETSHLVPAIEQRLGPDDLVEASLAQYLLLLEEGSASVRAHLHVVSTGVPWYWGTSAYPDGAILPAVPADVADRGRVFYVSEPEDPPPSIPIGFVKVDQVCAVRVCLTIYAGALAS